MYAQHAAESEAKLRKVLSKTASTPNSAAPLRPYMHSSSHADSPNSSPPLMMRKSQKPKFQA
ncbi:hypothetical protein L210DRAFT_3549298 [Boletus edulis BED1]|uniref:Uncharacterized protein n=1 Tax=Boletus edulis BED1 TaxID=1328754 RepID=A0AAD4BQ36_BOLED|nr:hypothetical protein L210DRAFT_3549298 [Boletus edulis BED1]